MSFPTRWVVALKPEADPIIEHFQLTKDEGLSLGGFPIFRDEAGEVFLVISGIGKVNAAAATAWLAAMIGEVKAPALWINFGIAGGGFANRGDVFRASRVIDQTSSRSWFPQAVWKKKFDLPEAVVETIDAPTDQYPAGRILIEMESAGFVPVALKFQNLELVQVVKVVSDSHDSPMNDITPVIVRELCQSALEKVADWLHAVEPIIREEEARVQDPAGFEKLKNSLHYSSTHQHQLRRLLQQWEGRFPKENVMAILESHSFEKGRAVLDFLRKRIWSR